MIIDFLNRLDISSENSFESLGQVLDSVAQVLEEIVKELTKKKYFNQVFWRVGSFFKKK